MQQGCANGSGGKKKAWQTKFVSKRAQALLLPDSAGNLSMQLNRLVVLGREDRAHLKLYDPPASVPERRKVAKRKPVADVVEIVLVAPKEDDADATDHDNHV